MSGTFALFTTARDGARTDLTQLVRALQWSGDYRSAARRVDFALVQTAFDPRQPALPAAAGDGAELLIDGESVFSGVILDKSEDSLSYDASRIAYDWGVYLKKNGDFLRVANQTPEEITRWLGSICGFTAGNIAETGVRLSRNFLPGDYFTVIRTLYELAGAVTGKSYAIRFRGTRLDVVERVQTAESLLLEPGSNLLSCKSRDSAQNLVNRVKVYDDAYNLAFMEQDEHSWALYGLFQTAIMASAYDDPAAEAKRILADGALSTTLVCECLGSRRLITGNTAVVHEPVTNMYGLFYIVADTHTWQKGLYRTKVELSLKDLVSEREAAEAAKEE